MTACMHRPPAEREQDVPQAYLQLESEGEWVDAWWTAFGDPQLDALIEKALQGNLTLEQADARLRQAEALAAQVGAARIPSVTGEADASSTTRERSSSQGSTDSYRLGLAASYEVDLWGRVSSSIQAADQSMVSTAYDLQTASLSVAAQTAAAYYTWQYYVALQELLQDQLDARKKILSVVEARFHTAQASATDVLQQRERVAGAEADLFPVKASLQSAAFSLSVLVGEAPQQDLKLVPKPFPGLPARPPLGVPADLLSRRPDIQAAWARLASADWDVNAAKANRLPTLRLTGGAAYENSSLDEIFDSWVANLAAGLTAPLIDGGRLKAEVALAQAFADERFAAYRQSVLDALTEVEDALQLEQRQQDYVEAVERQLAASSLATQAVYNRYVRGQNTFFEALVQSTAQQDLEVVVLQAHFELLGDRIQLYRALGGDWDFILQTYRETNDE
ncbi:efflux transporter outer membrane subunit [Kiritimatiellota bacterium B12222]|nr:efflux transporter outer membrane subunit [Kiritimatiellota bacterium B12222]